MKTVRTWLRRKHHARIFQQGRLPIPTDTLVKLLWQEEQQRQRALLGNDIALILTPPEQSRATQTAKTYVDIQRTVLHEPLR